MNNKDKGFTLIELGVVISLIALLAFAVVPRFFDLRNNAQETCARQLLSSLKTSAVFYTAQEKKVPIYFNDFVVLTGEATGSKTLSLDNIKHEVSSISMTPNTTTLKVTFNQGGMATYSLNGEEVTAEFTF
jgi:prepilin-type N-terminal cleavage/methylation domain-containing protein